MPPTLIALNTGRGGAPVTMNARCTSASQPSKKRAEVGIAHVGAHVLELGAGDGGRAQIERAHLRDAALDGEPAQHDRAELPRGAGDGDPHAAAPSARHSLWVRAVTRPSSSMSARTFSSESKVTVR